MGHNPSAANVEKDTLHIGAVPFIHRFCSSLNEHLHFRVCVVDGVFQVIPGEVVADDAGNRRARYSTEQWDRCGCRGPGASWLAPSHHARLRGRGPLKSCGAKDMLAYQDRGFSVDVGVCVAKCDRAALKRLLRYCVQLADEVAAPRAWRTNVLGR